MLILDKKPNPITLSRNKTNIRVKVDEFPEGGVTPPPQKAYVVIAVKNTITLPLSTDFRWIKIKAGNDEFQFFCIHHQGSTLWYSYWFRHAISGQSLSNWINNEIIPLFNYALSANYIVEYLAPGNDFFPDHPCIKVTARETGPYYNIKVEEIWDFYSDWYNNFEHTHHEPEEGEAQPIQPGMLPQDFLFSPFSKIICRININEKHIDLGLPPLTNDDGDYFADFNISKYLNEHITNIGKPGTTSNLGFVKSHALTSFTLSGFLSFYKYPGGIVNFDDTFFAIRGGISEGLDTSLQVEEKYFFEEFADKFLTWQPYNAIVYAGQPLKLYFLSQNDALADIKLRFEISYKNGSINTIDSGLFSIGAYTIAELNAGIEGLPDSENIVQFTCAIYDGDNPLTTKRQFFVNESLYNDFFVFRNSLGVFDSIAIPNPAGLEASANKSHEAYSDKATAANIRNIIKAWPAPMLNEWRRYIRELMISPEVYRYNNGQLEETKLLSDSLNTLNSFDDIHLVELIFSNSLKESFV